MTDKTNAALTATAIVAAAIVVLGITAGIVYTNRVNAENEHAEKIACIDAGGSYLPTRGETVCIGENE